MKSLWAAGIVGLVALSAGCTEDGTEPEASVEEQIAYIKGIVPHHQIAIMRADEALVKANRPGTKQVAQRMKDDQNREIQQFLAILARIAPGENTPAAMEPKPIPAGPEFDRMFYEMMIPHHQGAIDMSVLAHGANVEAELDSLAHHTIEEQREEQQEFNDSLRIVFNAPPVNPMRTPSNQLRRFQ